MNPKLNSPRIVFSLIMLGATCVCAIVAVSWVRGRAAARTARLTEESSDTGGMRLASGSRDTMIVSPEALKNLGVRTSRVEPAPAPDPLILSGSLLADPDKLVHVHTRFGGEVVQIATVVDEATGEKRQLRANDRVQMGQVLAVVWSKEVGEKKSDLVDALSQYWLNEANLKRLKALEKGIVPERTILEAERAFEASRIAVERNDLTLRSWRLTPEEIDDVKAEALRIHQGKPNNAKTEQVEKSWAEVDVRAPLDGIVLEKNIAIGDIVDTDLDVFKIGDLSKLAVLANVYEDDLPSLESLPRDARLWQVTLKANPNWPPIEGRFDQIGNVIDPDQHTGTVMGWINNRQGQLKIGEFITAKIALPPPKEQVTVPIDAVIERGNYSNVLVAEDSEGRRVSERKVKVAQRSAGRIYIQSALSSSELAQGIQPLKVGELVVTNGNVELSGALEDLRSEAVANQQLTRAP